MPESPRRMGWGWWTGILAAALASCGVMAALAYGARRPVYRADAWLLIQPRWTGWEPRDKQDKFIQAELDLLHSSHFLGPIARNAAVLETPELAGQPDPAETLARLLQVRAHGQSDLYEVSFSSASPEKAALVVNEVANALLAARRIPESEDHSRMVRLLEEERSRRYEQLVELKDNLRTLSLSGPEIDPTLAGEAEDAQYAAELEALSKQMLDSECEATLLAAAIQLEQERRVAAHEQDQPVSQRLALMEQQQAAAQARTEQILEKTKSLLATTRQISGTALECEWLRFKLAHATRACDALAARVLSLIPEWSDFIGIELFKEATVPTTPTRWRYSLWQ